MNTLPPAPDIDRGTLTRSVSSSAFQEFLDCLRQTGQSIQDEIVASETSTPRIGRG